MERERSIRTRRVRFLMAKSQLRSEVMDKYCLHTWYEPCLACGNAVQGMRVRASIYAILRTLWRSNSLELRDLPEAERFGALSQRNNPTLDRQVAAANFLEQWTGDLSQSMFIQSNVYREL